MSLALTRLGANAPGLPGPSVLPSISAALSRRAALFGAMTVAGVSAVPAARCAAALLPNDTRLVTRRALLGATAAAGITGLPVLAEAGILAEFPADPDAELFRLLGELPALKAHRDITTARQEALYAEFCDQEPERPDALRVRTADGFNVSQGQ